VQRFNEFLEQVLRSFTKQSDTRRAAILGALFGLLLCVIFVLVVLVLGFVAGLGD
jgi:ABC-type amino acid transport system permease subunit